MRKPCATPVCLVATLLSLFPSWEAQAQESVTAKVGDRVRVSGRLAVSGPITGTLRKIEAGSITVGRDDAGMGDVEVRVSQIEAVQLFAGTRNRAHHRNFGVPGIHLWCELQDRHLEGHLARRPPVRVTVRQPWLPWWPRFPCGGAGHTSAVMSSVVAWTYESPPSDTDTGCVGPESSKGGAKGSFVKGSLGSKVHRTGA